MAHLVKCVGEEPTHRIYEQRIAHEQDLREAFAHLRYEMIKCAREGKTLTLELWTEVRKEKPTLEPEEIP